MKVRTKENLILVAIPVTSLIILLGVFLLINKADVALDKSDAVISKIDRLEPILKEDAAKLKEGIPKVAGETTQKIKDVWKNIKPETKE